MQRIPLRQDLVRKMRWALVPATFFLVLFTLVVLFAYDFEGAAEQPGGLGVMLFSVFGVYAVVGLLTFNIWRKIPRRIDGEGLVLTPYEVSIDFGHGKELIDMSEVTAIVGVAARPGETPEAAVFCEKPEGDLSIRNRNRVVQKVSRHIARVHRFQKQHVIPLALFGEERGYEVVDALRAYLEERTRSKS